MRAVPVRDLIWTGPKVELAPISDKMFWLTNWPLGGMETIRVPVTAPLFVGLPWRDMTSTEAEEELGFTITSVDRKLALVEDFKRRLALLTLTLLSMLGSFVRLSMCVANALIGASEVSRK